MSSALWARLALVGVVLAGLATSASAVSPQSQKPSNASAPSPKTQAQQADGDALATKPCPRSVADEWDNCNGVSEFQNGDRYVGNFRKGLPDGIGTYYWKNGREYFGEFKRGLPNGKGKFTDMSNSVYIGDFLDGRMSGKATVDYQNGAKYVGDYKDDRKNGKGTYTYANGDKFVGDFTDDEMTPNGVLELANGDKYSGSFKSFKPQGKGSYIFKDGRKFTGDFVNGEPQGQGTLAAADGTVIVSGQFSGWDSIAHPDQRKAGDISTAPVVQETNKVINITPAPQPEPATTLSVEAQPKPVEKVPPQPTSPAPAPLAAKVENPKSIVAVPAVAAADTIISPLQCRFKSGFWYNFVECDVIDDTAEIKDISFNRGKCLSASEGMKQLQEMRQLDGGKITFMFREFVLKIEDFRGARKFGERIAIPVVGCANLLEYTVEANNTVKTWKTY